MDQRLGLYGPVCATILHVLLSCVSSSRSDSESISPQCSLFGLHIFFSSFCRICSIPDCCWYSLHFSWLYCAIRHNYSKNMGGGANLGAPAG